MSVQKKTIDISYSRGLENDFLNRAEYRKDFTGSTLREPAKMAHFLIDACAWSQK